MNSLLLSTFFLFILGIPACTQDNAQRIEAPSASDIKVGGSCENCDAIFESPVAFSKLNAVDTMPDFHEPGPKIEISGRILKQDGKTPAAGVVMYFYHTNQEGIYPRKGNETNLARSHGYLRGWIRTDEQGAYRILTLRPASYPNSRALAHIHAFVKEPGKTVYYIDDFLFADDPFLETDRLNRNPRGGSGVLTMEKGKDGVARGKRDIVLGMNVPGY